MASQSVLELAVSTGKWDSGLKKAQSALNNFVTASGGLQEALGKDSDKVQKFVQMMGSMESSAKSLKGKMNDYKSTIEQLTMQYNRMTDAQQKTIGQDYLRSIEQLRERYQALSRESQEMNRSLQQVSDAGNDTGGVMGMLAQRFTVNIDAMKLFDMGMTAVKGALNVAKDAFFNNEEQLDEWGRMVQSSESLYKGFLNSLNTGDISGFLSNMGNIVQAARDAYNAMDELNTFNAFNQINVEGTRTGMTESIADYRSGQGSKEAVKASGEAYKKELKERQKLESQAYLDAVKDMAQQRNVSYKDLLDALSGSYGHYKELKNVQPSGIGARYSPGIMPGTQGTFTQYTFAKTNEERLGEALRHLNDTELDSLQALGAMAKRTGNEIAQVDRQLARVLNSRMGGSGGSTGGGGRNTPKIEEVLPIGSMADLNKQMQDLRKEQSLVTNTKDWLAYDERIRAITYSVKELKGELSDIESGNMESMAKIKAANVFDTSNANTRDYIDTQSKKQFSDLKPIGMEPSEKSDTLGNTQKLVNGLQSVSNGLQQMGIKLPNGVTRILGAIQGLMSVIQAVQTVISVFSSTTAVSQTSAITANTGVMAGNTAMMGTLATALSTNTIANAIGKANGGVIKAAVGYIVPGRTFSGDMVPARLNAGETVLNQAQAGVIANALQDREFGGGGGYAQPYVEGEKIFLGMSNSLKSRGRGEIVTTGMLHRLGLI